jgi:hypothetical protein
VLVVAALLRERDVLAGVLLGLAVWNKIDAGLLAAAVAGAVLVVQRRFPWRVAAAAVLTVLPWTVFATIYFGSPVPNSFTAKLGHEEAGPGGGTDGTWILDFLAADWRWPLVALGAVATVAAFRGPLRNRVAVLALGGWFVMHALAYSLIDLGEPYPWYPTVLIPPLAVLGAAALARLAAVRARPAVAVAALAALAFTFALSLEAGRDALRSGYPLTPFEAFDTDRRLAGAWVERHGAPGEVIRTFFGWPAFEAPSHPINDMSLLNSKRMLRPPDYVITSGHPYNSGSIPPRVPRGYELLATFNLGSDMQVGYSWFTVVGRPDSAIARSRARFVQRRLFEHRRRPYSARFNERSISFFGNDMVASGRSGVVVEVRNRRQPVRVRFSPRVVREGGGPPATFEVRDGKRLLRRVRVPPRGPGPGPVVVRVPAERRDRVRLGFVVDAPPKPGNATWGAASIVIGGAAPDLSEIESEKVVEAWRANKLGPIGRQ